MKNKTTGSRILIFFILALIPVLMPLFIIPANPSFQEWTFPYQQFYLAFFGLILFLWNPELREKKIPGFWKKVIYLLSVFLILTAISFIIQKAGTLIPGKNTEHFAGKITKPSDGKSFLFCIFNFLFSAFYEESLYRFFLPEALLFLTRNFKDKKMVTIDCEIVACMLFALGHIYLGILSVINAALAYIVLRICYKKTESLLPGTIAHFLYNFSQLLLI